ncbi:MAG: hypothetical protein IJX86_11995 [Lachnospiraceae bacterium]|nr:hypothetical protein [Lachnospiraceae bacterium]
MNLEIRNAVSKEIEELSLAWNLSRRETMEEMIYHYYDSTPIGVEQLEAEFYSLSDEELFNKLCEL